MWDILGTLAKQTSCHILRLGCTHAQSIRGCRGKKGRERIDREFNFKLQSTNYIVTIVPFSTDSFLILSIKYFVSLRSTYFFIFFLGFQYLILCSFLLFVSVARTYG